MCCALMTLYDVLLQHKTIYVVHFVVLFFFADSKQNSDAIFSNGLPHNSDRPNSTNISNATYSKLDWRRI